MWVCGWVLLFATAGCSSAAKGGSEVVLSGWSAEQALREVASILDREGYAVTEMRAGASLTTDWQEIPSVFLQQSTRTRVRVTAAPLDGGTHLEIQAAMERNKTRHDPLNPDDADWSGDGRDTSIEERIVMLLMLRLERDRLGRREDDPWRSPELTPR